LKGNSIDGVGFRGSVLKGLYLSGAIKAKKRVKSWLGGDLPNL
jgi:hypothetical protein